MPSQKLQHIHVPQIFDFLGRCCRQEWPAHMTTRNRTKLGREKVLLEQGIRFSDVIKSLVCPPNTGRSSKLPPRRLSTEPCVTDLPLAQNCGWCHLGNGVKSGFLCLATIRENTFFFFLKLKLSKFQGSKNQIESIPLLRVNNPSSSTRWTLKRDKNYSSGDMAALFPSQISSQHFPEQ